MAKQDITMLGDKWDVHLSNENIIEYTDWSDNVLVFQLCDGVNISRIYPPHLLRRVKYFKFRPDDVYLPGYPRTGTNWTNDMTRMLLNRKAEAITGIKFHIEMVEDEILDNLPSPRVLNAHILMSHVPTDIMDKKCKIIYTLRDPRDVAVSMYKLTVGSPFHGKIYNGSFGDYLHLFLEGKVDYNGIFGHWRAAEKFFDENPDILVHFQVYEETIQDPVKSVKKLSDFLGLPRDDDLCKAIADKCEFSKMKADKDQNTVKVDGRDVIFRQGKSGDWKNYFTEELLEDYYRVYDEKMLGSRFYSRYARKT